MVGEGLGGEKRQRRELKRTSEEQSDGNLPKHSNWSIEGTQDVLGFNLGN